MSITWWLVLWLRVVARSSAVIFMDFDIYESLFFIDMNRHLYNLCIAKWWKCWYIFMFLQNNFARVWLKVMNVLNLTIQYTIMMIKTTLYCVSYTQARSMGSYKIRCLQKDVITERRFPHYCPFVRGIHPLPVDSPNKGLMIRSFDVFFVVNPNKALINQSSCRWFETPWTPVANMD